MNELILNVENNIEFYTNGDSWLIELTLTAGTKIVTKYFELHTTHNYAFNESMLVETTFERFRQLIGFSTFKKIDVNSRIDWAKMEVPQEKINKPE